MHNIPRCIWLHFLRQLSAKAEEAAPPTPASFFLYAKQYFSITKQWTCCITWLPVSPDLPPPPFCLQTSYYARFRSTRTSSTFYLWLSEKTFAFSLSIFLSLFLPDLAFYVALQRFATPHSAQQHAACRPVICSCRRNFSLPTFRGWQVFARLLSSTGKTLAVCCQIECDSLRSVLVNRRRETEKERDKVPGRCKL